ncbi:unnamed protein product [Rhizophagus irregularis]|nr:unnamed protein product [Rhizophagus irregularis]
MSTAYSAVHNNSCLPFIHTWVIKEFQHFCDKQNLLHFIISEPFNSPAPSDSNNNIKLEYTWRLVADIENIGEDFSLYMYIVALQTDFEREKELNDRISTFKFKVFKNQIHGNMNSFEEFIMFNQNSFTHRTKFGIKNAHGGKLCKINQLFPNNDTSISTDIIIRVHINEVEKPQNDFKNSINKFSLLSHSLEQFFNNPYFSEWTESNQSKIAIKGVKYEYYKAMVYYFYNGSLDSGLNFDALMGLFSEADMCQIEDLIEIVANKIVEMISNDNWHEILLMGWQSNNNNLKKAGLKFVHENWLNIKDTENMKFIIENLNVEWMEELIF